MSMASADLGSAVYDFKYFQGLPFGLFEFEDPIAWSDILSWSYISMVSKKLRSSNSHVGYKILRSNSPDEFIIALAIGLLLKSNTGPEPRMLM